MPVRTTGKPLYLFLVLAGLFITNALVAEFIGVKIFSLEKSLHIQPFQISLFGNTFSFNLTAGVLLWPVVFVITDLINEYYGKKGVRFLSYLTAGLIAYAFIMVSFAIHLTPADFWPLSHINNPDLNAIQKEKWMHEAGNYNTAFQLVFSQGLWIIIGSLVAFLVGQVLDVFIFQKIKLITGESRLWLRATGSTLISQCIDSFVVLFIAFYIGANWPLKQVIAIGIVNYIYKFMIAIAMTPVIYGVHAWIDKYLGNSLSEEMRHQALHE